ncbi:MAG: hypothetical protein A2Y38_17500 [Spirochaetes bacterium GWB1_59_5]|nr:MAG: hypothetical protein A2Y38_17500 [Spirochaetes bacterium GWB1_59_5]
MPLDPDNATAEGQMRMCRSAEQQLFDRCRTFNEIMTGPNPLTPAEVRKLIDRDPARYHIFERWATPC